MQDVVRILVQYRQAFLGGIGVTVALSAIIWMTGLSLGSLAGWLGHRFPTLVGSAIGGFSFASSSIPVIVILFWAHYPLQVLLNVVIDPFITAAWVLSLVNLGVVAAIVKGALDRLPRQFVAAARVCGLNRAQTFRSIVLPLLLREVTPPLLNAQVVMLQSTLFASLISVDEILRVSQRVNAVEYRPVEIYTVLALFFVVICVPLNGLAAVLRWRFGRDFSER